MAGWSAPPARVVVVGPQVEVAVAVADGAAVMESLTGGRTDANGAQLLELLAELGALATDAAPAPPPRGTSLADAIAAALRGKPPAGVIWTAEEALVLPPGSSVRTRTRALRAFLGGLAPDPRLQAYAALAQGRGSVFGDVPDPALLDERLAAADAIPRAGGPIVALSSTARAAPGTPCRLSWTGSAPARRIASARSSTSVAPVAVVDELPELLLCVGEIAVADLAAPACARTARFKA